MPDFTELLASPPGMPGGPASVFEPSRLRLAVDNLIARHPSATLTTYSTPPRMGALDHRFPIVCVLDILARADHTACAMFRTGQAFRLSGLAALLSYSTETRFVSALIRQFGVRIERGRVRMRTPI